MFRVQAATSLGHVVLFFFPSTRACNRLRLDIIQVGDSTMHSHSMPILLLKLWVNEAVDIRHQLIEASAIIFP